jgi:hypothetical protein
MQRLDGRFLHRRHDAVRRTLTQHQHREREEPDAPVEMLEDVAQVVRSEIVMAKIDRQAA